jgi:hypothetical protein
MNVAAAADRRWLAIPWRLCADETNMRGMPSGVGRGVGLQKRPELESTDSRLSNGDAKGTIAIAV